MTESELDQRIEQAVQRVLAAQKPSNDSRPMTIPEVARVLSCSPRTVARLIAAGRLETSKPAGRPLVSRESIDRLLASESAR